MPDKTGSTVTLVPSPDLAKTLAVDGGEPASDLHVTLAFLGEAEGLDIKSIERAVSSFANISPPIEASISGAGIFQDQGDGDVLYASVDAPSLPEWRARLVEMLEIVGVTVSRDHGFTPHMTLKYIADGEVPAVRLPREKVAFNEIWIWHDTERKSFSLNTDASGDDFKEIEKAVRQAFSSIGGKAAIANKLIPLFPPHEVFVEAFAGGAAVFFKKDPIEKEVLSDMNPGVVYLYQTIQKLSDNDINALARRDWVVSRELFNALRDKQRREPEVYKDELDKLYTALYLRHAVFGSGDPSKSVDVSRIGKPLTIAQSLPTIRDRLASTRVIHADARQVIKATDSPGTFFYLDPPYPVGTGERKDYDIGSFSMKDIEELFAILKNIRGRFLMSIPGTLQPHVPDDFTVKFIPTPVLAGRKRMASRELVVTNYEVIDEHRSLAEPGSGDVHVKGLLTDEDIEKSSDIETIEIVKAVEEQRLVWVVVMKPDFVDHEGHWTSPEVILDSAHRFLLRGGPIWLEHKKDVSDRVKTVQSWVTLEDQVMNGREIPMGSWLIVIWVPDDKIWAAIKDGRLRGGSVRGPAALKVEEPKSGALQAV
jgi:DNA adenine methylase